MAVTSTSIRDAGDGCGLAVLAVVPIPDLATARRTYGLHDLDDESVAKVLFHRRKQAAGGIESLRWDQCALGAVTLIQQAAGQFSVAALNADEHDESTMLSAIAAADQQDRTLLTWHAQRDVVPLLRYRAVVCDCPVPSLWGDDPQLASRWHDLGDWWTKTPDDRAELEELTGALHLPGLFGYGQADAVAAWLSGDGRAIRTLCTLRGLNIHLMALRLLGARGQLSKDELVAAYAQLDEWLAAQSTPTLTAFRKAWQELR
jgi:hypothetical protein